MAGMALQCVKDSGSYTHNAAELDLALNKIKQKLLASRRSDGHIGNEFSTGLAVQVRSYLSSVLICFPCLYIKPQTAFDFCLIYVFHTFKALLAMGSDIGECAASMQAMRTAARSNTYHNPMAISQTLPALHRKTYLSVKTMDCLNEDGVCRIVSTQSGHFIQCCFSFLMLLTFSRHIGAGACSSCCGFTKWDQSECDGGSVDCQWSCSCVLCRRAKGQHPAGLSRAAWEKECWFHVSSLKEPQ